MLIFNMKVSWPFFLKKMGIVLPHSCLPRRSIFIALFPIPIVLLRLSLQSGSDTRAENVLS